MTTTSTPVSPELLDQLYGTWTFVSQSEADMGYYKAKAYLVVHFMPDPSQATLGCTNDQCDEFENQLCQDGGSTCANTETDIVQWSDVAALYQFGFQVDVGAAIKTHIRQGTGDWLGPYNVILAEAPSGSKQKDEEELVTATSRRLEETLDASSPLYVSRMVQTASTQYIKAPPQCNVVSGGKFEKYAGLAAIQHSIQNQTSYPLDLSKDPYADQLGTCEHGSLDPVLPRFTIQQVGDSKQELDASNVSAAGAAPTLAFSLRYPILSLPDPKNELTKWWPTLQKRLSKPNLITGPYCFDGALKAYTIDLHFETQGQDPAWQFVKGCVDGLPCWHDIPPESGRNHPSIPDATSTVILKWVDHNLGVPGLIALSVLLLISLICNLRLCCKVRAKRRRLEELQPRGDEEGGQTATTATTTTSTTATTATRQRRQGTIRRTVATRRSNATASRQSSRQPAQSTTSQQQQPQPRSAQILTPSRLERKRDDPSDPNKTPKKSDPSAPSQPIMDRTPAPKKAPQGGKMDRTPIVNKSAAAPAAVAVATKKDTSAKEPSGTKTIIAEEVTTADQE